MGHASVGEYRDTIRFNKDWSDIAPPCGYEFRTMEHDSTTMIALHPTNRPVANKDQAEKLLGFLPSRPQTPLHTRIPNPAPRSPP